MAHHTPTTVIFVLAVLLCLCMISPAEGQIGRNPDPIIQCNMGYGQRGLHYSYGVKWPRTCDGEYCWEAVTDDIEQMRKLFDFPWNSYYKEFYIQGCGGAWGSPPLNPYILVRSQVDARGRWTKPVWMHQNNRPLVTFNVTVPATVTTEGGTFNMKVAWACIYDFCNAAAPSAVGSASWPVFVAATTAAVIGSVVLSAAT